MTFFRRLGVVLGLLAGIILITGGARAQQTAPADFLHVAGQTIVDGDGQPVLLRGVNVDTDYWRFPFDPQSPLRYATEADMHALSELGATVIRLGVSWQYFDTTMGYNLVDDYLSWAEATGIYVILDMHVVLPDIYFGENRIWDDPAAQEQFISLWVDLASRYQDQTIIAGYDLANEPGPPEAAQWWDLVRRTIPAIRTVDPNHILFVEEPLTGDYAGFQLQDDPNVVYSYHDYSPFSVTHAGATWIGDTPLPTEDSYPGEVLTDVQWMDYSRDHGDFTGQTDTWMYWESAIMTPPDDIDWATVKPQAWGNIGTVWFDDLELLRNGVPLPVYNAGIEDAVGGDDSRPVSWYFYGDGDFSGAWGTEAHTGSHSLEISGTQEYGLWTQANWILTLPLFSIEPGDTFQVRGWILAPENQGGVGLGLDYLKSTYEYYDRDRLLADIQPYLDWAATNHVPLFVGEFGGMAASPGDSRYNLIHDKIDVMNANGLHWTMWHFRDTDGVAEFGLYQADRRDERLADILRQGMDG
ncbi:MAG: cellulase family glycosylhydrolase [Anaerolineaceae bacterium]|nr:cellulase family glycosylhydrolase [Anaerolineaceae bacterium]